MFCSTPVESRDLPFGYTANITSIYEKDTAAINLDFVPVFLICHWTPNTHQTSRPRFQIKKKTKKTQQLSRLISTQLIDPLHRPSLFLLLFFCTSDIHRLVVKFFICILHIFHICVCFPCHTETIQSQCRLHHTSLTS